MDNKIVLCIVEGISDKDSLGVLLSKLFYPFVVKFYIIKGDVTSELQSKSYNIESKIKRFIDLFLKDHKGIKKTDIFKVIHLVDMDGAYIDDTHIIYCKDAYKNRYENDQVVSNKVETVIQRNIRKQKILNRLSTTDSIWNIPYRIYYFSCHLEHVLHKELNVENQEKEILAMKFIDYYIDHELDFVELMEEVSNNNQFEDSWNYIKEENHSIQRASNLLIGIREIMNGTKGEV